MKKKLTAKEKTHLERKDIIKTKVPGKIILSGEYSVLYNKPALVVPINKYLYCDISKTDDSGVTIELNDFKVKQNFTLNVIKRKGEKIEENLKSQDKVILKNFELTIYILYLLEKNYSISLNNLFISIISEIPINHGLGSSAAFIVCLLKSLKSYYCLSINNHSFIKLAIKIEDIIHGKSSGLDINAVFYEKPIFFNSLQKIEIIDNTYYSYKNMHLKPFDFIEQRSIIRNFSSGRGINSNFFIINTGKSESSTKQCIDHVIQLNKKDDFWRKFEEVTLNLKNAILEKQDEEIKKIIKINHKLLCELNVVPQKIIKFIHKIEEYGGVGKISGAGNIKGDNSGIVIVFIKNKEILLSLCKKFKFEIYE